MTPEPQQQPEPEAKEKGVAARRRWRSPWPSALPEVACRAPRSVLRKPRCQTDEQGDASSERSPRSRSSPRSWSEAASSVSHRSMLARWQARAAHIRRRIRPRALMTAPMSLARFADQRHRRTADDLPLAIQRVTGDEPDVPKLHQALVSFGITAGQQRPGRRSAPRADGTIAMGESNADKAVAEQTQSRFVAALTSYGLAQDVATQVFTTARQWASARRTRALPVRRQSTADRTGPRMGRHRLAARRRSPTSIGERPHHHRRRPPAPSATTPAKQVVGLATALQESGLRNIRYGDRDSLGLFQQRANWGSAEQRLTPSYAAGSSTPPCRRSRVGSSYR